MVLPLVGTAVAVVIAIGLVASARRSATTATDIELNLFNESLTKLPDMADGEAALALIDVVRNDIRFYARQKRWRMIGSLAARLLAMLFAGAGILSPLIGPEIGIGNASAKWGIAALAASGLCFSANELFGWSKGHARAVTAQYALMERVVRFRIDWLNPKNSDKNALMSAFAADAFNIVKAETGTWSMAQEAALQKLAQDWVADRSRKSVGKSIPKGTSGEGQKLRPISPTKSQSRSE